MHLGFPCSSSHGPPLSGQGMVHRISPSSPTCVHAALRSLAGVQVCIHRTICDHASAAVHMADPQPQRTCWRGACRSGARQTALAVLLAAALAAAAGPSGAQAKKSAPYNQTLVTQLLEARALRSTAEVWDELTWVVHADVAEGGVAEEGMDGIDRQRRGGNPPLLTSSDDLGVRYCPMQVRAGPRERGAGLSHARPLDQMRVPAPGLQPAVLAYVPPPSSAHNVLALLPGFGAVRGAPSYLC